MSEQLYNLLFNPNHQMPSIQVILMIAIVVIGLNAILRYWSDRQDEKRRRELHSGSTGAKKPGKKKK